jgi:23S rRNA (cytosine1962-C5)-methyltransferase
MSIVVLHEGKEKSLYRQHPWVYEGAVAKTQGRLNPGATVSVLSHEGKFLAKGAFSPTSTLRVRVWSFDEAEVIDHAFFKRRVVKAVEQRQRNLIGRDLSAKALRWLFGEADGLPGCIIDQYAHVLVIQFLAVGVERWRDAILQAVEYVFPDKVIYERSDASGRSREGLEPKQGWIKPPENPENTRVQITENSLNYWVDVATGHKTGWYLDQANNRALCADWVERLIQEKKENVQSFRVLNTFCYTGGFSLAALEGAKRQAQEIEVVSVDASQDAILLAQANVALNGFDPSSVGKQQWVQADVFDFLKQLRLQRQQAKTPEEELNHLFDLIVLDPPKFASSHKQVEQAARAYKQINLEALRLLKPGGVLLTFSCSGAMDADLFRKVVAGAVADARVSCVLEQTLMQPFDHPVIMSFPEGEYLKGLVLRHV